MTPEERNELDRQLSQLNKECRQRKKKYNEAYQHYVEVQRQRDQVAWRLLVTSVCFREAHWRATDTHTLVCEDLTHFESFFPPLSRGLGDTWHFHDEFTLSRGQDGEVQLYFLQDGALAEFVQVFHLSVALGWNLEQLIQQREKDLEDLREQYRVLMAAVGKVDG